MAYEGSPSVAVSFTAFAYALAGMGDLAVSRLRTWVSRRPSGIVTALWIREDGASSSLYASAEFMCLCRRKNPGCRQAGQELCFTALTKELVLATTPDCTSRGPSDSAVSPGSTCTVTSPVPGPE